MTWRGFAFLFAGCFAAGFLGALAFLGYDAESWITHNTRRHT